MHALFTSSFKFNFMKVNVRPIVALSSFNPRIKNRTHEKIDSLRDFFKNLPDTPENRLAKEHLEVPPVQYYIILYTSKSRVALWFRS
jgi:hypothetical protein